MKRIAKMFTFLLMPLVLSNVSCNKDNKPYKVETTVKSVTNAEFGNVDFETTQTEIEEAGIEYGDTVNLTLHDVKKVDNDFIIRQGGSYTFENLPFVTNYNEVGYYAPCLCNYQKGKSNFDIAFGLSRLKNHSSELIPQIDETTKQITKPGIKVSIVLNTKGGYNDTLNLVSCPSKLPYEKVDRNNLVYANFRDVTTIGDIASKINENKFFRGSSPFNAKKNNGTNDPRYLYADKLLGTNNITHEVSLSIDNKQNTATGVYPISEMFKNNIVDSKSKTPYSDKIYGYQSDDKKPGENELIDDTTTGKTFVSVGLGSDYFYDTDAHKGKTLTKRVIKFIADSCVSTDDIADPRIYIHCDEGKDRTGFFSMVVEALCGVSYRDIVADFMCTFKNYFEFSRKDDASKLKYDTMKKQTVCRHVYSICVDDPSSIDWPAIDAEKELKELLIDEDSKTSGEELKKRAEAYIKRLFDGQTETGVADEIIYKIQTNIGKKIDQ